MLGRCVVVTEGNGRCGGELCGFDILVEMSCDVRGT